MPRIHGWIEEYEGQGAPPGFHPDQDLPGRGQGGQGGRPGYGTDPGYGQRPPGGGNRPSQGLPGQGRPGGGGQPSHPISGGGGQHPWAPPHPDQGPGQGGGSPDQELPELPPEVGIWPPPSAAHPIVPVPPDHQLPPGAIWPPLPDHAQGKFLVLAWVSGEHQHSGWHYVVIDTNAKPDHSLPGGGEHPGNRPPGSGTPPRPGQRPPTAQPPQGGTAPDQGLPPQPAAPGHQPAPPAQPAPAPTQQGRRG